MPFVNSHIMYPSRIPINITIHHTAKCAQAKFSCIFGNHMILLMQNIFQELEFPMMEDDLTPNQKSYWLSHLKSVATSPQWVTLLLITHLPQFARTIRNMMNTPHLQLKKTSRNSTSSSTKLTAELEVLPLS